eukprot:9965126-Alexandrium_andersonii.AAC.1
MAPGEEGWRDRTRLLSERSWRLSSGWGQHSSPRFYRPLVGTRRARAPHARIRGDSRPCRHAARG